MCFGVLCVCVCATCACQQLLRKFYHTPGARRRVAAAVQRGGGGLLPRRWLARCNTVDTGGPDSTPTNPLSLWRKKNDSSRPVDHSVSPISIIRGLGGILSLLEPLFRPRACSLHRALIVTSRVRLGLAVCIRLWVHGTARAAT